MGTEGTVGTVGTVGIGRYCHAPEVAGYVRGAGIPACGVSRPSLASLPDEPNEDRSN